MWETEAACRPYGNTLWFSPHPTDQATARSICRTCPVINECQQAGQREPFGIWAGTTARQRRLADQLLPPIRYCPHCRLALPDDTTRNSHPDCEKQAQSEARKQARAEASADRACERCGAGLWPQARTCIICRHTTGDPLPNRPWPGGPQ